MKAELRERILAYNRAMAQRKEKAEDMDVIATALLALPPGQLKKLLTPEVLAVLDKYGKNMARKIFRAFFDGKRRGFAGAHADATMRL